MTDDNRLPIYWSRLSNNEIIRINRYTYFFNDSSIIVIIEKSLIGILLLIYPTNYTLYKHNIR